MFGRKKKKLEGLVQTGSKAVGEVLSVTDTTITDQHDNPKVVMMFRIEPLDGSDPFEARKSEMVPRAAVPQRGDRYPVWYDPNDHEIWAFAMIQDDQGRATIRAQFGDAAQTMTGMGSGTAQRDPTERLQKLQRLHDSGAISEFEFEDKKAQILSEI